MWLLVSFGKNSNVDIFSVSKDDQFRNNAKIQKFFNISVCISRGWEQF